MQWRTNVLVVANVTATSDELMGVLAARAERESIAFTLIVPANPLAGGRAAAHAQLTEAIERLPARGLEVAGSVGASDAISAVSDEWDPRRYDEIVVSTLPMHVSKWLHAGLPERIAHLTGAQVTHVVSEPAKPAVVAGPAPVHDKHGVMAPLSALRWGRQRDR
jgi:hypothetical protein